MAAIRAALPPEGIFVKDICQTGFASYLSFPVRRPRTYVTSGYQGTLGFAFPPALGAKVGRPDQPVVCVTGDGGFMFAAQELSTAAQHGIAVVTVVFNNRAYGNVRRDQANQFDGRVIASGLPLIDYMKMAQSLGVEAAQTDTPAGLGALLTKAIAADTPYLVEVTLDLADEVSPWPLIVPGRG